MKVLLDFYAFLANRNLKSTAMNFTFFVPGLCRLWYGNLKTECKGT